MKMHADTVPEDTNGDGGVTNSAIVGKANRNAVLAHTRAPRVSIIPFEFQHPTSDEWGPQESTSVSSSTPASYLSPHTSFASWTSGSIHATCCSLEKSEVGFLIGHLMYVLFFVCVQRRNGMGFTGIARKIFNYLP
jgi:hypothetical protein